MKVSVTYEFASEAEALAHISRGGAAPNVGLPTPAQAPAAPVAPPAPAPAASAPPAAPVAAPPAAPAPAASVAPPPAPPAAAASPIEAQVLQAMSSFAKVHKAAGVKQVFAMLQGPTKVPDCNPAQLEWLLAVFNSGQMPG